MRYWWVSQKQTYHYEVPGGYMWSPKWNKGKGRSHYYDLMKAIEPGDIIFSYAQGKIKAIGVAQSNCYEFPKPIEFGNVGDNWGDIGWRVDVNFRELDKTVSPKSHIDHIRPLLPSKYSPLQLNGNGNQAYLFGISKDLALFLAHLIDYWVLTLVKGEYVSDSERVVDNSQERISEWEDRIEEGIKKSLELTDTERSMIIKSRRGHGKYRRELFRIESSCRVTRVDKSIHLIASHTKPWRDSTNEERLDPENGFMLTPTIDHLFDRGYITFENSGELVVSEVAHQKSIDKMGIDTSTIINVGTFRNGQKHYLDWHRSSIFLGSKLSAIGE